MKCFTFTSHSNHFFLFGAITHIFLLVSFYAAFIFFVPCFGQIYCSFFLGLFLGTDIYLGFLAQFYIFSFTQISHLYALKLSNYCCQKLLAFSNDSGFQIVQHLESVPLSYSQILLWSIWVLLFIFWERGWVSVFIHFLSYFALHAFLNLIPTFRSVLNSIL